MSGIIKPMFLLYIAILADAFLLPYQSDLITFGLLGLYALVSLRTRSSSASTFYFCLLLFVLMYIQYTVAGPVVRAEKLAVWVYLFFAAGIIQKWRE